MAMDIRDNRKHLNSALWVVQILLAALYLFAGGMKLVIPAAALGSQVPLPVPFMRFIAVAEVLGAIGLVAPGLAGIQTALTPLAAGGLVVIMIGATGITIMTMGFGPAIMPLVAGLLAAGVAYGRWRGAPLCPSARLARA